MADAYNKEVVLPIEQIARHAERNPRLAIRMLYRKMQHEIRVHPYLVSDERIYLMGKLHKESAALLLWQRKNRLKDLESTVEPPATTDPPPPPNSKPRPQGEA